MKPKAPSQPPPPVFIAPAPPPPSSATTTYVATNAIAVTSAVLTTNYVLVTNTFTVTNPVPEERFVYHQKPLESRPWLVTPEQARAIIDRFRANYSKIGSPRMLIYVNRELVDEQSGMKLSARSERVEMSRGSASGEFQSDAKTPPPGNRTNPTVSISAGGNLTVVGGLNAASGELTPGRGSVSQNQEKVTQDNVYRIQGRKEQTLADRQTVRDVERLFGRPLRLGGVRLADQRIATQLIGDKPIQAFTTPTEGEQARKDRQALSNIADVVLEILISSRQIVVPEISGDKTYSVPDIQATAIRLSDSQILGQATASDLIGRDRQAGRVVRHFDVRDIAEATALSLMEDILMGIPMESAAAPPAGPEGQGPR